MSYSMKRDVFIMKYRPAARNTASNAENTRAKSASRTIASSVVPWFRPSTIWPMKRGGTTAAIDPTATARVPRRSWVRCRPTEWR